MNPALLFAAAVTLVSCYFAACQLALRSFSHARLSELLERRKQEAQLPRLIERLDYLLLMTGTLRTCLNLAVVLALTHYVDERWPDWELPWKLTAAFVMAAALVSVLSVALASSLARHHPERLLARSLKVLLWLLWLFTPMIRFLRLVDPVVRRISGVSEHKPASDELSEHILSVVEQHDGDGSVDQAQRDMLEAVVEFRGLTVGEIMTPRTEISGIERQASLDQIKHIIIREGHSRYPVYEESLDHIVGVLYAKDLIRFLGSTDFGQFDLRQVMRSALMVPESKPVRDLLAEFKASKVHIATVLDEYGGTAGIVTIEDIVEEIVGDIQDEYEPDTTGPDIRRLDNGVMEIDARMRITDLNNELDLELPDDQDFDTVGGFVFSTLGHIPVAGESFTHGDLRFTVIAAERTRVRRVRLESLASHAGHHAESAFPDDR